MRLPTLLGLLMSVSSVSCSGDPVMGPPAKDTGTAGCDKPCLLASKTPGYPTCGCGTRVGELMDNYEYRAKNASKGGASAPFEILRFGDLYDPDRKAGRRFMVLSVSALWCVACKEEAKQLPALSASYGPRGVVFVTNLAQNVARGPSVDGDVDLWISAYKLDTWVVRDDAFSLKAFFDPASMPLNLIVDLQTMRITSLFIGASLEKIKAELDSKL